MIIGQLDELLLGECLLSLKIFSLQIFIEESGFLCSPSYHELKVTFLTTRSRQQS